MASVADLNAKVSEVNSKIADISAAVGQLSSDLGAAIARVQSDVDFLKEQIANGVDLGPAIAQLDEGLGNLGAVQASLVSASSALQGVDPLPDHA